MLAGQRLQASGRGFRELQLALTQRLATGFHTRVIDDERRRRSEAFQVLAPEGFSLRQVLPIEPGDVIAKRTSWLNAHLLTASQRFVSVEDFAQHQRTGPAVEQQMMVCPGETIRIAAEPNEREPHQWRRRKIETALPLLNEKRFPTVRLFVSAEITPVVLLERHAHVSMNQLQRLIQVLPDE